MTRCRPARATTSPGRLTRPTTQAISRPATSRSPARRASQNLTLASTFNGTLAVGQTIAVHITGVTTTNDATTSTNPALNVGGIATYTVLYEGTGNNQLSITNDTVDGNIGVGGGQVQFSGPGTIGGRLDFSAANTGQYHNTNGSNVGPTSVNYNVSAVTTAINAVNSLSTVTRRAVGDQHHLQQHQSDHQREQRHARDRLVA